VSSLLPLLADYVRYCPRGSLHFIAYLPKLVQVWHFRKFNAAKVSVTRIIPEPANLAGCIPGIVSQRTNASVRGHDGVVFSADRVESQRTRSAPQPPDKEDEEPPNGDDVSNRPKKGRQRIPEHPGDNASEGVAQHWHGHEQDHDYHEANDGQPLPGSVHVPNFLYARPWVPIYSRSPCRRCAGSPQSTPPSACL
jgi:hypothetical protein